VQKKDLLTAKPHKKTVGRKEIRTRGVAPFFEKPAGRPSGLPGSKGRGVKKKQSVNDLNWGEEKERLIKRSHRSLKREG